MVAFTQSEIREIFGVDIARFRAILPQLSIGVVTATGVLWHSDPGPGAWRREEALVNLLLSSGVDQGLFLCGIPEAPLFGIPAERLPAAFSCGGEACGYFFTPLADSAAIGPGSN